MATARTSAALLVVAVVALAGCDGATSASPTSPVTPTSSPDLVGPEPVASEPTDCPMLAARIVDVLQKWVDSFPAATPDDAPTATPPADLATLAGELAPVAEDLGCGRDTMMPLVAGELDRLTAEGAVQQAVADTLRADPLGTLDPSDPDPEVRTIRSGEELVTAIGELGSDSTIELPDGTIDVDQPLVLLRPLTITGTGTSMIRSSAEGAAFVLSTDGDVTFEDFVIGHRGDLPASGVVVTAGGYELSGLTVRGAVATASGAGGFGVAILPSATGLVRGGERSEIRSLRVEGADGGGIVIGGSADPELHDVTVVGSSDARAGCGLCWVGDGAGTVTDATVRGWEIGLRVDERANPVVEGGVVQDSEVGIALIGDGDASITGTRLERNGTAVEAGGTSSVRLVDLRVSGSRDVGVRISGGSSAMVRNLRVSGPSDAGLAVVDDADPTITGGEVSTSGEVAVIWGGRATGSLTGMVVQQARIGLQVGDRSAPEVVDLAATDVGEVAVVATGTSAGSLDGLTCDDDDRGRVILVDGTLLDVRDVGDCPTVEQPVDDG